MPIIRHRKTSAVASFAAALAAFAGFGASPDLARAQAWQPTDDDAVLLQVGVGNYRLQGDVRGYQTPNGACVDLGDMIQALDLPIRLDKKSRRATGWMFTEAHKIVIDRESASVQNMNIHENLAPGEIHDTPEGWCVDTKTLSRWMGITVRADLYNSALLLEGDRKLPFIEAIERKSRAARLRPKNTDFDLASLPQAELPYRAWRTPAVDALVRFEFKDGPGGRQNLDRRYELFASGEALGASFDARMASDRKGSPDSLRVRAYRIDPGGRMLGPLGATQIAAGDVETFSGKLSGQTAVGRGAMITNRPPYQPSSFARTDLRGSMPDGWDAELYRNGQLLAFQGDARDGRYEFLDIDLLYGNNSLEVVLYGPQGQIRRERHEFPVGVESIRPGVTSYWAGIVEQNRDLIDFGSRMKDPNTGWRWGVGVERGIDKRTMAGIGLQSLVLEGRRESYAEMTLRRALGPMLFELSAAQQFGRGRAYRGELIGKIGPVNFQAESFMIEGGYQSDVVDEGQKSEHVLRVDSSLMLGRTRVPFQLAGRRENRLDGTKVTELLTRASIVTHGLSLTGELNHLKTTGDGAITDDDGLRFNMLANTRVSRINLRGEARFRLSGPREGFEMARVVAERDLDQRSDLRAEVAYNARNRFTEFKAGYVRDFTRFQLRTEATYDTRGVLGANLSLAFSFGANPNGAGLRFSNEKLARNGQAAVTVFRDDNGDGVRSPEEPTLPEIGVEAGFRKSGAQTDKRGHAVVDGLRPWQPVLVSIDTGELPDPYLQPVGKGVVVTPRPGVTARIELPLAPTGEIEGTIMGLSGTPQEGVALELVDGAGQILATTLSEYDGFFLFDRVPYGRYRLRIKSEVATALKVQSLISDSVQLDKSQDLARLGVIRLSETPTIASAAPRDADPKGS